MLACCVLAEMTRFPGGYKKIIEHVRKKRDKRCVESRKQEDFVKAYTALVANQRRR